MDKTESFEYTRGVLKRIEAEARAEIAAQGGNPYLEKVMDFLSEAYVLKQ